MDALKKFSPAFFAVVIFCFVLPFVNITCSGQTIVSLTGFQLITGTDYKYHNDNMFKHEKMFDDNIKKDGIDPEPIALLALLAANAGLVLSLTRRKISMLFAMISGVLGAVFMIMLKVKLDNDIVDAPQAMIQLNYLFPFWLALVMFIAAAVVFYLLYKEDVSTEY